MRNASMRKTRALRALAATCAIAVGSSLLPVMAQAEQPAKNWMSEYVKLRVAERTMAAMPDLREADIEKMMGPMIVGGTLATASDNPFQVALLQRNIANTANAQFCGGTLYKANYIITAAHCSDFVTTGQVQVLTGTRRLDGSGVRRNVTRIVIHPSYNASTYDYDVAVWQLSSSATGAPLASLATADPAQGTALLATGWGATSEGGSSPIDLRKVSVPLASRTNCNDSNSYSGEITSRMLCAGRDSGGIDTCQGDSGGPLARGSVLTGITSWGNGCASPNYFGVYTRISNTAIRNFITGIAGS
ncbi:serine protease [Aquimonas sp.]|jgi:secreted trypsin-like serine protease|uniref:serine protease n=1 Tax=Aquimonas sp. TaxID=1872588 RepID=UPI0037BF3CEE